jgi:hypothetical protein
LWFTAAWLARHDGMELMGTEGFPDGFSLGGDFELPDLAQQRQAGVHQITRYEDGKGKNSRSDHCESIKTGIAAARRK